MQKAFLQDEALLADIARARTEGRMRVWWLGQSGFLLVTPSVTILFDPYLSDSLTKKYADTDKPHTRLTHRVIAPQRLTGIDIITSSHNHTDHLDAETLLPLFQANPRAQLVIPKANRHFVQERLGTCVPPLVEVDAGQAVHLDSTEFHGIAAAHNTVDRDTDGHCKFLGYVVRVAGKTFYHSGDTLLHDTLASSLRFFAPDVAFLPINGNLPERRVAGNLNGREAAQLAFDIQAGVAIPHHFDMFAFNTASPEEFESTCRQLGQNFQTLRNGEGMDV